jgi:uncharacterized protein (TIGR02996 family)
MTQEEAFLWSIIEEPGDDAHRLIYADWLEEQGDPRGELIRIRSQLARIPTNHSRRRELEAREQGLWEAHKGNWLEEYDLPLTWELVLALFSRRLGETMAWCARKHGSLRTPALQPPHIFRESRPGALRTYPERRRIVHDFVAIRARLLAEEGNNPWNVTGELAGGKLLLFWPDQSCFDGAAEAASKGFFDSDNVPAWDTWVWYASVEQTGTVGLNAGWSYLVSWVPPELVELVDWGIRVNPEQCILWATDVDTPLTSRLWEAGLLT